MGMTSLNQCEGMEGCISSPERAARNLSAGMGRLPLTRSLPTLLAYKEGTVSYKLWGRWRVKGRWAGRGLFFAFDIFL